MAIFHFLNSILRGCTHLSQALKNEVELHQKADYLDSLLSEGGLFGWFHLIQHDRIKLVNLRSRLEVWVFRNTTPQTPVLHVESLKFVKMRVLQLFAIVVFQWFAHQVRD